MRSSEAETPLRICRFLLPVDAFSSLQNHPPARADAALAQPGANRPDDPADSAS